MIKWFDKLSLQPQERTGVLAGMVLVALVFNYWFVWPYFSEWSTVGGELSKLEGRRSVFQREIVRGTEYRAKLAELEKRGAGGVLEEEQANRVQNTINAEAANHNVGITRLTTTRSFGATNAFFNEEVAVVDVVAGEAELIGFLHALGSGDSMIRVRDMNNLGLDPSQQKLMTKLTLVASFQKKVVSPPPAAPRTNATPQTPAATSPPKSPSASRTNRPAMTNSPAKKK